MPQDSKVPIPQRWLLLVTILVALVAGLLTLPATAGQPPGSAFLLQLLLWQGLIWGCYGLIRLLQRRASRGRVLRLDTHP